MSAKTVDDSRNEFLQGKVVFFQNGAWEYVNLEDTFKDEELAMRESRVFAQALRIIGV